MEEERVVTRDGRENNASVILAAGSPESDREVNGPERLQPGLPNKWDFQLPAVCGGISPFPRDMSVSSHLLPAGYTSAQLRKTALSLSSRLLPPESPMPGKAVQ